MCDFNGDDELIINEMKKVVDFFDGQDVFEENELQDAIEDAEKIKQYSSYS